MSENLVDRLTAALRAAADAFAPGDQIKPCAVLWPDPERLWESVLPQIREKIPELFVLGQYDPAKRSGPALWLRCIEARAVEGAPAAGVVPVFYLPGVGKETLRAAEDCPQLLAPLVEMQYRGTLWLHPNSKEWTPFAFLVSKHGGLGLDVGKDQATLDAIAGALPVLLDQAVAPLAGRRLDADFFNELLAPDASGLLLRWLHDPEGFTKRQSSAERRAFLQLCKTEFQFDPEKEGALKAARLLTEKNGNWNKVWARFGEAPANYPGVVEWLKKAAPRDPSVFDTAEAWPHLNERDERQLREALEALADRPQDVAIQKVLDLEKQHGCRRSYVWSKLGMSPLAEALAPLSGLAAICQSSPGSPDMESFAEFHAVEGWRADAAALASMAACTTAEQGASVLGALRAIYLPWLEASARHLQQLLQQAGGKTTKRHTIPSLASGRVVLFADGLRFDIAKELHQKLEAVGILGTLDWDWSTVPSVTASAKPAVSPVANAVEGHESGDEFSTRLAGTSAKLTHDRFLQALKEQGWQCLGPTETGDPSGSAWTEFGTLDKRGHNDGWKLARAVESELADLASHIGHLLDAGWSEVVVTTDHGWLLMPGGLPKVEFKAFFAEHRWGRCAVLKSDASTDLPVNLWHWNESVGIASPHGVGCFKAGVEYSHGGVSLQEMVIPRLIATRSGTPRGASQIKEAKWTGARCRVEVGGSLSGLKVDVRTAPGDAASSLLADKSARDVSPEGRVALFLEDDASIGTSAEIVLLDAAGAVIDSIHSTIGK